MHVAHSPAGSPKGLASAAAEQPPPAPGPPAAPVLPLAPPPPAPCFPPAPVEAVVVVVVETVVVDAPLPESGVTVDEQAAAPMVANAKRKQTELTLDATPLLITIGPRR